MPHVLVWDIETVPDLVGFAAANGHDGKTEDEIRAELGEKFPEDIYHSIICIGALIAHQQDDHWVVDALGAPHVGDRSERDLIAAFADRIAELNPQLVTFNGSSFDLPVLRYRAMVHKVPAIGLAARPYFKRYTDDAVDLCDVLSSFSHGAKSTLHELCRVMGLAGKPDGINGAEVAQFGTLKLSNPSAGFRLPQTMLATVDSICAQQDLTRSQVFRRSIMEFIKRQNVTDTEPQQEWFAGWRDGLRR
jgi:predicted PolB exonuclease-like 3'-5' exonuclease/predicted transcriptional regulator